MANIFVVFMESRIDLFLGWSRKEKYARKYAEKTLQGNDYIRISNMNIDDPSEIFDIPFNVGDEYLYQSEIIKDFGFYLTRLEWEMLTIEFDQYKHLLASEFERLYELESVLSSAGKNRIRSLASELENIPGEKLFKNFIQHHDFIQRVIEPVDIIEREQSKDAYKQMKQMDQERKEICGLDSFDVYPK